MSCGHKWKKIFSIPTIRLFYVFVRGYFNSNYKKLTRDFCALWGHNYYTQTNVQSNISTQKLILFKIFFNYHFVYSSDVDFICLLVFIFLIDWYVSFNLSTLMLSLSVHVQFAHVLVNCICF